MDRWAPLFSRIVESSVWDEDDMVCKVWITLLAVQDSDHVVRKDLYQLHRASRKTIEEVARALEKLAAPDTRRPDQPDDGRRIRKVEDGWLILNGQTYEELMRKISRQVYQAKWAREHRAKLARGGGRSEVGRKDVEDNVDNGRALRDERLE